MSEEQSIESMLCFLRACALKQFVTNHAVFGELDRTGRQRLWKKNLFPVTKVCSNLNGWLWIAGK